MPSQIIHATRTVGDSFDYAYDNIGNRVTAQEVNSGATSDIASPLQGNRPEMALVILLFGELLEKLAIRRSHGKGGKEGEGDKGLRGKSGKIGRGAVQIASDFIAGDGIFL